jgi:hypothetical protein
VIFVAQRKVSRPNQPAFFVYVPNNRKDRMKKSILLSVLASVALMFSMAASGADHFKPEGFGSIPAVQTASKDAHKAAPVVAVAQGLKISAQKASPAGVSMIVRAVDRFGLLMHAAQPSFVLKQTGTHADRGAEGRERGKFAI